MPDFTYRGVLVVDDWPTAARVKGAARPSDERWTAFFEDGSHVNDFTQAGIKEQIRAKQGVQ